MGAALDGVVEATGAVFEAKFMPPWPFSEVCMGRDLHPFAAPGALYEHDRPWSSRKTVQISVMSFDLPSLEGCHAAVQ